VIVSETGMRSFLALLVEGAGEEASASASASAALRLVAAADAALAEFGKDPFYSPPLLHASIATVEGDAGDAAARAGIRVHRAPVSVASSSSSAAAGGASAADAGANNGADGKTAVELLLLREWGGGGGGGGGGGSGGGGAEAAGGLVVQPPQRRGDGGGGASGCPLAPLPPYDALRWAAAEVCCRVGNTVHRIRLPGGAR
jgi:hypothetical protein